MYFMCYKHAGTIEFLDSVSFYMFLPNILCQTKVTGHSQAMTDNIFLTYISKEDHLSQVLLIS